MTPESAAWPCSICGGPTVYQTFSGGREWYCEACDTTGEYPEGGPGLPRATLLRTPEGAVALRAQMDQELARRAKVRATPLAPYDGTDDEVIQRTWGSDAVFCTRCFPGMWHHRDYHRRDR